MKGKAIWLVLGVFVALALVLAGCELPVTETPDPGTAVPSATVFLPTATKAATVTPKPPVLPTIKDPGFETGDGWSEYSWVGFTRLRNNGAVIPEGGVYWYAHDSTWLAWLGRVPDYEEPKHPLGELSVVYQKIKIPDNIRELYLGFWILIRSEERVCNPDYPADHLNLMLGTQLGDQIVSSTDKWVGVLPICNANTMIKYRPMVLPTNLAPFAGQELYFKIAVRVDGSGPTHVLLDDVHFLAELPPEPSGFSAQGVEEGPIFIEPPSLGGPNLLDLIEQIEE